MPWESIGSVDTGEMPIDESWINFCQGLAISYITLVCGKPPLAVELGIMSNDHDLGSYPSIGVYSEFSLPYDYVSSCEDALDVFNSAISWETLKEHYEQQFDDDEDDDSDE